MSSEIVFFDGVVDNDIDIDADERETRRIRDETERKFSPMKPSAENGAGLNE
jgi:hypothetical protein